MAHKFTVTADWDADAGVFTSVSDIPGLVIEAGSFEKFVELVEAFAADIISSNVPNAPRPYTVEVKSRRVLAVV
jgi:hypothetical protein